MKTIKRYFRLYLASFKICLSREMIFRAHFLVDVMSEFVWISLSLLFLSVIYFHSGPIVGWKIEELVVLLGTSRIISGFLDAFFHHIRRFSDLVNRGDLDFFLIRPASSQFLVSTRVFSLHGLVEGILGLTVVLAALRRLEGVLGPGQLLLYLAFVTGGLSIAYSLWLISVLPVFWVGRLDNVHHLFLPFLQITRVPIEVFEGGLKMILTLVIPVAFMATIPAKVILGFLRPSWIVGVVSLTTFFLFTSSQLWSFALKRYSSASS